MYSASMADCYNVQVKKLKNKLYVLILMRKVATYSQTNIFILQIKVLIILRERNISRLF